jgi:hypothetical protein
VRSDGVASSLRADVCRGAVPSGPAGRVARSAPRPARLIFGAGLAVLAFLALGASSALGAVGHPLLGAFGSANRPSFVRPESLAVDQSTGDLLVVDAGAGTVSRWHADGSAAEFSATGTNVIDGAGAGDGTPQGGLSFGAATEVQVAVDNSGEITDGDIYVTQLGSALVDVFSEAGAYLGQLTGAGATSFIEPCGVSVDSEGNVYIGDYSGEIYKFDPVANHPVNADHISSIPSGERCGLAAGSGPTAGSLFATRYEGQVSKFDGSTGELKYNVVEGNNTTVTVDPATGIVYTATGGEVNEFDASGASSAIAGSSFDPGSAVEGIAVHGATGDIYVARSGSPTIEVFGTVTLPVATTKGATALTAESATLNGEVNPDGVELSECFFEYGETIAYGETASCAENVTTEIGSGNAPVKVHADVSGLQESTDYHFRLVAKNVGGAAEGADGVFRTTGPPRISGQTATEITATEATLRALVNPENEATSYHFEYVDEAQFQTSGYAHAIHAPAGDASAGAGGSPVAVARWVNGLAPATRYHFRLVASNLTATTVGEGVEDRTFTTYPAPSAGLPDHRGYELVTPADTNGQIPVGKQGGTTSLPSFGLFNYPLLTQDEDAPLGAMFYVASGSLPGLGGAGTSDRYEAVRGEHGWSTRYIGQTGAQAEYPAPGSANSDHSYSFLTVQASAERGSFKAGLGCSECAYLRSPDGHFSPVGEGELATDLDARGRSISPGGSHVIFTARKKLEANSPAAPIEAVYDRTSQGLQVISLLPGNVPPGSESEYLGASADGSSVAFRNGTTLYLRRNDSETLTIAEGSPTFAGISADGDRVFYLAGATAAGLQVKKGELFSCDASGGSCAGVGAPHAPVKIGGPGNGTASIVANVSADGSHVYFISPDVLTGTEENGHAKHAEAGARNFYVWDGATTSFIAQLDEPDVIGSGSPTFRFNGLGLWTVDVLAAQSTANGVGNDPSRATPDGSALVFQSSNNLTAYNSGGHSEVYRYDASAPLSTRLVCVSCGQTGAVSDATLEDPTGVLSESPIGSRAEIANVTTDGKMVFFETADELVPGDGNGVGDVYEWETEGAGGCVVATGCVHLISSGRSSRRSYLYGMSSDGHDVLFWTAGALVAQDHNHGTPTIYDARIDGGFPPPEEERPPCQGDACQGQATAAPTFAAPGSPSGAGSGNVKRHRHKKKHKRHHHHQKHHQRANHDRRTGR